ncbi:MAG: hypothetical protein LBP59_03055, partial [Planctomycetaceae bacterium]|nr:hypothetical protein [Planctomycetaceae bacterium]
RIAGVPPAICRKANKKAVEILISLISGCTQPPLCEFISQPIFCLRQIVVEMATILIFCYKKSFAELQAAVNTN